MLTTFFADNPLSTGRTPLRRARPADKKIKYALYDGKNVYVLSDQQTPESFAGQRVTVTGALFEKTKIIQVDKIEAAGK